MKVTEVPEQVGLEPAVIAMLTDGVTGAVIASAAALDVIPLVQLVVPTTTV